MTIGRPREDFLTERNEEFCHYYVSHGIGARAAREVGITKSAASGWAAIALKKKCVRQKIKEIRKLKAAGEDTDRQAQVLKLDRVMAEALRLGKTAIALACVKEQNLLKGYRKDSRRSGVSRPEGEPKEPPPNIGKVSDEELEKRIAQGN